MTLRGMFEKEGGSRWLHSLEEAEVVVHSAVRLLQDQGDGRGGGGASDNLHGGDHYSLNRSSDFF